MITKWTQHLRDPKEKEELEKAIRSAKPVLDRLKDMVEDQIKQVASSELDVNAFDNPNWAYKQAYKNGYKTSLRFLETILNNLDHQKEINNDKFTGRRPSPTIDRPQ